MAVERSWTIWPIVLTEGIGATEVVCASVVTLLIWRIPLDCGYNCAIDRALFRKYRIRYEPYFSATGGIGVHEKIYTG
jgi:hypothetical protein